MQLRESQMRIDAREKEGRIKVSQEKTNTKLKAKELMMELAVALKSNKENDITEQQIYDAIDELIGTGAVNE